MQKLLIKLMSFSADIRGNVRNIGQGLEMSIEKSELENRGLDQGDKWYDETVTCRDEQQNSAAGEVNQSGQRSTG